MPTYVSDEVWRRLDPSAGRLSRRTTLRGGIAVCVVLVLVVAVAAFWRAGLVVPRLIWPGGPQQWQETGDGGERIAFGIVNVGRFPVTVVSVGRSGPGLQLLAVEGGTPDVAAPSPFPVTLQPGTGIQAVLVYRITDCAATPTGPWPVTAVVERPWGRMTVDVAEQGTMLPWQEAVVSTWCQPGRPR